MTLNTRFPPPRSPYIHHSLPSKSTANDGRIDIDSLPRLPQKSEPDSTSSGYTYDSDRMSFSPSVWDRFRCVDTGSATHRFVRATTNHIPAWPSLDLAASIPLACIFTPFASPGDGEEPVPLITLNSETPHPMRCPRCNAFVNPSFRWFDEGYSFECNICKTASKVPMEFFSPINVSGTRRDKYSRPELRSGSVDYLVPDISVASPPLIVFIVDSSYTTCNFFSQVLSVLNTNLLYLPIESEIAIMFSDKVISLVRFAGNEPSLVVIGDVNDTFVPDIPSSFFVSPHLLTDQVDQVLGRFIPQTQSVLVGCKTAVNSAIALAVDLIGTERSGSIVLFQANPSFTSIPQEIFERCIESKICLDVFSWELADIPATTLAGKLGGEIFILSKSFDEFSTTFKSWIKRERVYNVMMKVRCSNGLKIEAVDAPGQSLSQGGVHFIVPRMTSKSLFSVQISITENLEQSVPVHLQLACLYTREDGTRLTRIHNTILVPVGHVSSSFKFADAETIAVYILRRSVGEILHKNSSISCIRDSAIEALVSMLCAYRIQCASRSSSGQLVLPDSLKTLPLLVLGMLKLGDIRRKESDKRSTALMENGSVMKILGWSFFESLANFLPRLYCVYPGPEPTVVPATRVKLIPSRIYCFETASGVLFYVGREVQPSNIAELFGDDIASYAYSPKSVGVLTVSLQGELETDRPWIRSTRALIDKYARLTQSDHVTIRCIIGGSAVGESKVSSTLLVEDQIDGELCYMDWLCLIHKHIQEHVEY